MEQGKSVVVKRDAQQKKDFSDSVLYNNIIYTLIAVLFFIIAYLVMRIISS